MPRSLPAWNDGKAPLDATRRPTFLLIADDVLGGLFAINGGALGNELGMVFYLAPDTLDWENLALGYSEFLAWALSRGLSEFYQHLRWPGWQDEVAKIAGDRALSVDPFLWAEGPSIEERSRRAVPAEELYRLTMDMRQQLAR
ncbi:DUF2625 family protein [Roseateles sp. BYS78W]|uniref:DUF2625 family protein n=1 Tax=Pelomonas candidula TaxID=3299025 RepID=A0ABW7HJ58_9BURK